MNVFQRILSPLPIQVYPRFIPNNVTYQFILMPNRMRRHQRSQANRCLSMTGKISTSLIRSVCFVFVRRHSFPLINFFIKAIMHPRFRRHPILIQRRGKECFIRDFTRRAFRVRMDQIKDHLIRVELYHFPRCHIIPSNPFRPIMDHSIKVGRRR